MNKITLETGKEIKEDLIVELAKIEMNEGSHMDNKEDYDSELDFFLSGVKEESYPNYFLNDYLENKFERVECCEIQDLVIAKIKELY